jgi:N,N'-diacetyllegionaminate synthase
MAWVQNVQLSPLIALVKTRCMSVIRLGKHEIGEGCPALLVAEIGINHNGDLALAKKMVVAAAQCGADAVKFQNYRTEDFLSDRRLTYTYRSQGREVTESQWEMFKRCEPPPSWWPELRQLCDDHGILFFSTPTAEQGVDELVKLDVPLLKNGSDYLTHVPLLEYMGATGIPIVVSTGMADQQDVDDAVAAVRRGSKSPIILLHCTSVYPTPPTSTNLRRMVTLQERYGVPVGFSDHTQGHQAACQAVTLGACLVEKHFTLHHDLPGPDHWFSSTPAEFAELVREVRASEARLGMPALLPDSVETVARQAYRLSVVAALDLPAGTKLCKELVVFRRPGNGLLPRDLPLYLGQTLGRPVPAGYALQPEDFLEHV